MKGDGITASGKPSLLKGLKSKKAQEAVREMYLMLNKSTRRSDTGSILTDMDIFRMSEEVKEPREKLVSLIQKMHPNISANTNPALFLNTFKTSTVEMAEELFKRLPEASRKNR